MFWALGTIGIFVVDALLPQASARGRKRESDQNKCYQYPTTYVTIYFINTNTTTSRMTMSITKIVTTPLKMPMMLPKFTDGSVSADATDTQRAGASDDMAGVVESLVTMTPIKSCYQLGH